MQSTVSELRPHPTLADRRVLAVLSPANWSRLVEIESELGMVFPNLDCVTPGSKEQLDELVRSSHGRKDIVIAVGGDGTLHRVLQNLDLAGQTLGLLPGGTGNDLARTLGFPRGGGRTAHLATLEPRPMDIGVMNGVRFHNSGGFGLDAATVSVREQPHGLFRRNYNLAFGVALCTMKPFSGEITADGRTFRGSYWWLLVMNNRDIGKGTRIAPRARLDDGLLDLILVEKIPRLELLRLLPSAVRGEHLDHPAVTYVQAASISCRTDEPVSCFACDGELYSAESTELEISVKPGALKLLR